MFLQDLFRFLPRSSLRRALSLMNRGEFESAATLLDTLLQQQPGNARDLSLYACLAWIEVAKQQQGAGDLLGAIRALERATTLQPGFADVQFLMGQVCVAADRPHPARLAFERALELNPRYVEARLALARVLALMGQEEVALASLRQAAEHAPELAAGPMAPWLDPRAGESAARGPAQLEASLTQLLESPTAPVSAGVDSARRALRTGDHRRAIDEIKHLLRDHPRFPDLHNLLGLAYDSVDMVDDAVEEFERALALNANFTEARLNLGLTLFHRGRHDQAEKHLRRIEAHHPGHVLARTILADIEAARILPREGSA